MTPKVRLVVLSVVSVALVSLAHSLVAFNLLDFRWPQGQIDVEMQLGPGPGLMDQSESWDHCVIKAINEWNAVLVPAGVSVNPILGSTRTPAAGDRINSVFFDADIFGTPFGAQTLAVTSIFSFARAGIDEIDEADIVYNDGQPLNCYRGATQLGPIPETGSPIFDARRLGAHEFGHFWGLSHPDDIGQVVDAIMNAADFIGNLVDVLQRDDIEGVLTLYGVAVTGIPFPPRDQVLAFFLNLENEYRDTLGRQKNNPGNVNAEGTAVWLPEFLRYVLNACSATEATNRVLLNIETGAIQPVCGVVASPVNNFPARNSSLDFPPRNVTLDFLVVLDNYYRDVLNETAPDSYIDLEGKAVWLEVYLGYRVNGCNNQEATDRVFTQIRTDGSVIPPNCA